MSTKRKYGVGPAEPGYHRARYLWAQYEITPQDVRDLLVVQNFQCAICLDPIGEETCRMDHNHQTTQRRGLLCHHCNVGIGHFREDVEILKRAITYLTANVPD